MKEAVLNGKEIKKALGLSKIVTVATVFTFHSKKKIVRISPVNSRIKNNAWSKYYVTMDTIKEEEE